MLPAAGYKYLGRSYEEIDCQAFVEACLRDIGIRINLPGSNSWYRFVMQNGWTGTPEECRKKFGQIPAGAFLFILEHNGREPEKFRTDGIGNASHIGIVTGQREGAIHSSLSRGCVAESKFKGKTIRGGWNAIGLWKELSYGEKIDGLLRGTDSGGGGKGSMRKARVVGGGLNLRKIASRGAESLELIPDGTELTVMEDQGSWSLVEHNGKEGWVMNAFLKTVEDEESTTRARLMKIYDELGDILGLRG